jgi:Zn-dependent M16 (insulinase) family peptidase
LEYQQSEDTPEALAAIPMLGLADIGKEIEWYAVTEKTVANVPVLHFDEFTNDIIYSNLYFDVRVLPQELIPYASLLSSVLGKLSTENYSYGELDNALNINTGGFYASTTSFLENKTDEKLLPKLMISSKATIDKAGKLFELIDEILNKSNFGDSLRLKELITREQARVDSDIKNNGLNYAMTRLNSYYLNSGMYNELVSGLEYYRFITGLSENFNEKAADIQAKLSETARLLFAKGNLTAGVTCSQKDYPAFSEGMEKFATSLSEDAAMLNDWKFDFEKKNEGLLTASKVQYVVKGYDYKKLGYKYDGKMRVLNQVLSTDWLQNQIRVIGGAYGGFAGFSPSGNVYFGSYRDPNLKETLENYDNTVGYLDKFEADEKTMTRFIIGTVSRLDQPMNVSDKGNLAFQRYFEKTTPEELKAEREAVLSTTPADIKAMSKLVADILGQDAICVYGNDEKIKANAELFGELVKLDE